MLWVQIPPPALMTTEQEKIEELAKKRFEEAYPPEKHIGLTWEGLSNSSKYGWIEAAKFEIKLIKERNYKK